MLKKSNGENSFLSMPKNKLKKTLAIYISAVAIIFIYVILARIFQLTSLLFIVSVNSICAFIFIQYSNLRVNKALLNHISVNLFIMALLYFYLITTMPIGENYSIFRNGLYDINLLLTTLLIHLIVNLNNENVNKKVITIKYLMISLFMILVFILYINKFIGYQSYIYIILFVDLMILYYSSKISNNKSEYIYTIFLLITDFIILIFIKKTEFIFLVRILRFALVNLIINIFTYNVIFISQNMQFKDIKEMNTNLFNINREIAIKNELLEASRKETINQDNLYKEFLQIVDMPIIIFSKSNNRIKYSNKKFLDLVCKDSLRGVINKKITEFIDINSKKISRVSAENNEIVISYIEKGNEVRVVEISLVFLSDYEIIAILNDITEKENMYKLKRKIDQKRRNEKMKKNFLSNISHDLKTPVGVLYSATQLQEIYLKSEIETEISRYNTICLDNCIYLNRLTNNIMDISRISERSLKPKFEYENIVYFVEEKVGFINEAAKLSNIKIIFDTEEEEIYINFDREFTERIILNLLSNSLKYSKDGSEVKVNIKTAERLVMIDIIDNGVGMSNEFISKAFDLYSMDGQSSINKGREKGTGIGLYVVYNLVKLQNASINVESQLGIGSKFTITFSKENNDAQ